MITYSNIRFLVFILFPAIALGTLFIFTAGFPIAQAQQCSGSVWVYLDGSGVCEGGGVPILPGTCYTLDCSGNDDGVNCSVVGKVRNAPVVPPINFYVWGRDIPDPVGSQTATS